MGSGPGGALAGLGWLRVKAVDHRRRAGRRLALLAGGILWLQPRQQPDPDPITFPSWYPLTNDAGDAAFADFENHIPCLVEGCDRLKFGIVLYRDASGAPTTYLMSRVHVAVSDDRTVNTGTWSITNGTSLDPDATVYRLDSGARTSSTRSGRSGTTSCSSSTMTDHRGWATPPTGTP